MNEHTSIYMYTYMHIMYTYIQYMNHVWTYTVQYHVYNILVVAKSRTPSGTRSRAWRSRSKRKSDSTISFGASFTLNVCFSSHTHTLALTHSHSPAVFVPCLLARPLLSSSIDDDYRRELNRIEPNVYGINDRGVPICRCQEAEAVVRPVLGACARGRAQAAWGELLLLLLLLLLLIPLWFICLFVVRAQRYAYAHIIRVRMWLLDPEQHCIQLEIVL